MEEGKKRILIMTDSGSDISQEEAKELGIHVIPLKINWGEDTYLDDVTITHAKFYEWLKTRKDFPSTSQTTPFEYEELFEEALKEYAYVICIPLSSGLSGSFESAQVAAKSLADRVFVVDSLNVTIGQRLLVMAAKRMADEWEAKDWDVADAAEGLDKETESLEALVRKIEEVRNRIRVVAVLDTLDNLRRGGRIPAGVALAGNLLSIKPLIEIRDGKVVMIGQARGSKAAEKKMVEIIKGMNEAENEYPSYLAYSGASGESAHRFFEEYKAELGEKFENATCHVIGAVIGTHAGPGAIAVAFV